MDYFYSAPENIAGNEVVIVGDEFAHLTHVMRKTAGEEIVVVDGMGRAYAVRVTDIRKKTAHGTIVRETANHNEPSCDLTIAAGILKNPSKFDFLVEKVTELGARRIIPLITQRTIPEHAKIDRWQKLALAAMKQCGRSYLPMVTELTRLTDLFDSKESFSLKLMAHEDPAERKTKEAGFKLRPGQSAVVLIGPEGGFSGEELLRAESAGFEFLYFGERRLRTETAAIVSAARLIG